MTSVASSSHVKVKKPIYHSQAREIARKVLENCEIERKNNCYKYLVNQTLDRAVFYTGISRRTMLRIKSESKSVGPDERLETPNKRKKRGQKFCVDDFDRTVIHNTVTEFYIQKKIIPTCPMLLAALRERIPFPWSSRTLQRLLVKMGFMRHQCQSNRPVLIEKPDIVFKRYQYLKKIRVFRQHERNIIYLDERLIDNHFKFKKCWQMIGTKGILTETSYGNKLIVVTAGSKIGFIPGATLMFKAGATTGHYRGQMNSENFEKWVTEKLLPSLPERTVLVMDNSPYHWVQLNKPPTKSSPKSAMIKWLQDNNVSHDVSMRKPDLFKIIEQYKPVDIDYKIDNIVRRHGHEIIRMPPFMFDLNPVELAWAAIKHFVREQDTKDDLCLTKLEEITTNAMSSVTTDIWENFEKHVLELENEYWEKDIAMENEMDNFVIEVERTTDEDSVLACSDVSISSSEYDSDE